MKASDTRPQNSRDLKYFHGEAAASSLENAGAAYHAPSMVASGAQPQDIAFLSTITNLIFSIILIKIPSILDSRGSLKRLILIFSFVNIATWIPLILVMFIFNKVAPFWLIILWFFSLIPTLLIGPIRDNWLAESAPTKNLGRYLSIRSALSGITYLGVFYFMGYILSVSGEQIFKGYALITFIGFIGASGCFVLYKVIRPPVAKPDKLPREPFTFPDFIKTARRGQLGNFILYVSVLSFAVNICSAYFTVYMLRDLSFGYLTYTLVISAEFVARIVSLAFWGKMVDRAGSLRVMKIASIFIPVIPVLWLFSYNAAYLVVIQFLSGTVWAAFDLCNQTYVYGAAPKEHRLRYIVYHRSLSTFAMAIGALAGAFVLPFMLPVFGSRILGLFLASGILRLVVIITMYPRANTGNNEVVIESEREEYPLNETAYVSPRLGLARQVTNLTGKFSPIKTKMALGNATLHPPENWGEYSIPVRKPTTEKMFPPRRGLYYHPDEWKEYIKRTSILKPAVCQYDVDKMMERPREFVLPPNKVRITVAV